MISFVCRTQGMGCLTSSIRDMHLALLSLKVMKDGKYETCVNIKYAFTGVWAISITCQTPFIQSIPYLNTI